MDYEEAKEITPFDLLDLIRSEPNASKHIFQEENEWHVTQEWLVGGFAGRSFVATTPEKAAAKQIEYLTQHIGHDSIVGERVTESGWPSIKRVKEWLLMQREDTNDEDIP